MQLDDIIIFLIIAGSIITSIVRSLGEQNKKRPPPQGQRPPQPSQRGQTPLPGQNLQGDFQKRLEEARRRVQQAMENQTGRGADSERGIPPLIRGGLEGQVGSPPPPLISGGLEGTSLEGQTQRRGTLESSGGLLQENDYTLKPLVLEGQRLEREPLKPQELSRTRLEDPLSKTERNVFRPIDIANRSEFQQQMTTVQPFMSELSHRGRGNIQEGAALERRPRRVPTNAPKHAKISGSELLSPEMLTEKELLRGFLWQQILSEPRAKTGYKTQLRTYPVPKAKG
jgi:hypothetical protein